MELVCWRHNDAVHAALQIPIGPEKQRIRSIPDNTSGNVSDVLPTSVPRLQLQPSKRLGEKKGDTSEICMAPHVDVVEFLIHLEAARVVFHVA